MMGVLSLQSCTRYRIVVFELPSQKVYYPEKKKMLSEWEQLSWVVNTDLDVVKSIIKLDKNSKISNTKYIKIK